MAPRPIAIRNRPVWPIRLSTMHVQSIHQSERLSVVIVLQPHSWRRESSPNDWLTNNAHSTSTLCSNDLEKGWGKPSEPPSSGRLCLGVWHDQTSLYVMFESSSPCSCSEFGKVWLQNVDVRGRAAVGITIFHAEKCVAVSISAATTMLTQII